MTSMDDLSEDTIHYEIMPFLSYEDRINFNRTLKPEHRRTKKFAKKDKNVTLKHELSVLIIQIKITIAKVEQSLTSKDSFNNILKVVKLLLRPRFSIVIAHYVDFRQNLFNKIQNLYTLAGGEFNNISKENKNDLEKNSVKKYYDLVEEGKIAPTKIRVSLLSETLLSQKDKKTLTYNYIGKYISIFIVEKGKETSVLNEQLRRHGSIVADSVNLNKGKDLYIYNQTNQKSLSLFAAEGMVLGNYQFIKHKPTAEKNKNTLQSIIIANTNIKQSHIDELNIVCSATILARDLVNKLNNVGLSEENKKYE